MSTCPQLILALKVHKIHTTKRSMHSCSSNILSLLPCVCWVESKSCLFSRSENSKRLKIFHCAVWKYWQSKLNAMLLHFNFLLNTLHFNDKLSFLSSNSLNPDQAIPLGLIWVQAVWHSDVIADRCLQTSKKNQQMQISRIKRAKQMAMPCTTVQRSKHGRIRGGSQRVRTPPPSGKSQVGFLRN